jgi:hypothetical protein
VAIQTIASSPTVNITTQIWISTAIAHLPSIVGT